MKIKLAAELQPDSVVDGSGIRTVIWTQGCEHNCFGCHNPDTHNINGGAEFDIEEIFAEIDKLDSQDGITFSGGDPMMQPKACYEIAKYAKSKGLNIWCYTGYTFERLKELSKKNINIADFLNEIDVLIDGPFILKQKSFSCKFRGSSNQRIIDLKRTLHEGQVILLEEAEEISFSKPRGIYI